MLWESISGQHWCFSLSSVFCLCGPGEQAGNGGGSIYTPTTSTHQEDFTGWSSAHCWNFCQPEAGRGHTAGTHTAEKFFFFFLLVPKTACRVSPTFFKESFFFFSRTTWVWYFLLYYFTSRPRKEHKEQRSRPTLLLPSHPHFLLSGRRPEAPPQYEKPWTLLLRCTAGPRLTVLLRAKRTVCWKSRYVAKSRRGL